MNDKAEQHLMKLKINTAVAMDEKYRAGQAEHGGFLGEMGAGELLDNAIDEAIDQVVYLLTLRDKLNAANK